MHTFSKSNLKKKTTGKKYELLTWSLQVAKELRNLKLDRFWAGSDEEEGHLNYQRMMHNLSYAALT